MVGRNYRRTHSVYVYAYACIVHACAPLLHAYAPTLHSYASVFNSSYKCMPQHAYAYTGFAYICRYSETSFFVQFGFFFFSLIFLIQHDSHAPVPVFYRLYLLSFTSRGSAGHLFAWYRALTKDTKALVSVAGFKPVMCLLSESFVSSILGQALAKRWWDTTHTFHITRTEMTVTPHDFHQKTSLRSNGAIINLKSESGIQLGIDLLGCRYSSEHILYFDLERDYKPFSQATPNDYVQMAKAFLLYLLGVYLLANGGQIVSLRWFALFRDFEHAWEANWGQTYLAYLYSIMDTLSRGTLGQLARPWKLFEVRPFSFFTWFHILYFVLLQTLFIHMPSRFTKLHFMLLQTVFVLFYLQSIILQITLHSCKLHCILANYHLANCHFFAILAMLGLELWLCCSWGKYGPEGLPFSLGSP